MDPSSVGDLFSSAGPRFVNPAMVAPDSDTNALNVMTVTQRKWFVAEVANQLALPNVLAILKLYRSIPIAKLGRFCNIDPEVLKQNLVFIKSRTSQLVRTNEGSAPSEGTRLVLCDVNFSVVHGDMVSVLNEPPTLKFAKFFANNAVKFQAIYSDLSA